MKKHAKPKQRSFYSDQYTADEMALITVCLEDLSLEDEIWLQRVFNRRLLRQMQSEKEVPLPTLIKAAEVLARGTGRVAQLLRDRRALSGEAADGLSGALAQALDEIGTELGVDV